MTLVDTNIILRWLLNDHKELAAKAEKLINSAKPDSLLVTDVIIAEIVYVLRGKGFNRQKTCNSLLLIKLEEAFKFEKNDLTMDIISLLADTKLDFADCYLLARTQRERISLETFDKALYKALPQK